jgi:hypothetical protein
VCRGCSPLGATCLALHCWPISAPGCSGHAARPQAPLPSPAGCRGPRGSMRKWSHRIGADAWSACATAWCSAPGLGSRPCWPHTAGRSTRRAVRAAPSPSAHMSPPSGGAEHRDATVTRADASHWPSSTSTLSSVCRTPADANRGPRSSPPTGMARPNRGVPVDRPWRQA